MRRYSVFQSVRRSSQVGVAAPLSVCNAEKKSVPLPNFSGHFNWKLNLVERFQDEVVREIKRVKDVRPQPLLTSTWDKRPRPHSWTLNP